jgi:hypothetical protein
MPNKKLLNDQYGKFGPPRAEIDATNALYADSKTFTLERACKFILVYNLPEQLKPLVELLPMEYWEHIRRAVRAAPLIRPLAYITVISGWYSGTGAQSKRVNITDLLCKSCVRAGLKFKAYNDAKRGGVTGEKVTIYLV